MVIAKIYMYLTWGYILKCIKWIINNTIMARMKIKF